MASVRTTDGVELVVHDLGGQGPPLVFVHATGLHGLVWRRLAAELTPWFHCISFDRRAHGDSTITTDWNFDWWDFASDVLAVLDGLGLSRPFALGHSSGGTALLMAEQARPGALGRIYCFEPIIVPADPPLGPDRENWLAAAARRRREVFASRRDAYENYLAKPPFTTWLPSIVEDYVDHGLKDVADGTVRLKCQAAHEAEINEMATAHDCFRRLAEVRCPVTMARGSRTDIYGPGMLEAYTCALPCVNVEGVPAVGHFGPLEDPFSVSMSVRRSFGLEPLVATRRC